MCEAKCSSHGCVSRRKKNVHLKVHGAKTLTETVFSMMIELNSGWRCKHCEKETNIKNSLKMHIESEHMGISHLFVKCVDTHTKPETLLGTLSF